MVEVVRDTFKTNFPDIDNAIRNCDFVALDSEFTGLKIGEGTKSNLFDDASARYKKLRKIITQITMSQFGLSLYTKVPDENKYIAKTYNIYLCPRAFGPVDPVFFCQASSLEFLCKYDFDFNKFIREGVSHMNEVQIQDIEENLSNRAMFTGLQRDVDEKAVQKTCSAVADWVIHNEEGSKMVISKDEMNNVRPYILSMELRSRFPSVWTSIDKDSKHIEVEKVSGDQRESLEVDEAGRKKEYQDNTLDTLMGFTKVIRVIKEARKPLVGHNMLMDLMLLYDKCHKPLPQTYEEFKTELHSHFPCIYDTKHMVLSLKQGSEVPEFLSKSSLSELYTNLSSPAGRDLVIYAPEVFHADGFTRYQTESLPHEAGYDAYMCGFVFLRTLHYITYKDIKSSFVIPCSFRRYLQTSTAFVNKINLIRANVNYMNLDGPEPVSKRPELLFVKSRLFKRKLDLDQLGKWFSPYGAVDIEPFGSSEALVATGNYRCAKDILKAFRKNNSVYVTKYSRWRHSPTFRRLLWSGVVVSGGLCLWAVLSSNKKS